jgi:hypothetical protein
MAKWDFKDIGLAVIFSYVIITVLNYILNQGFGVPIVKTGVAILLFGVGVILSCLFIFLKDGKFEKEEVRGLIVILVLVVVIYFGIKMALPELFSAIAPQKLQEVMNTAFSFIN